MLLQRRYLIEAAPIYQVVPTHHSLAGIYSTDTLAMAIEEMGETPASKIQD